MFVFTGETVFSDATLGQKVCFGAGEAARFLREVVAELGAERVMVIASGSQREVARRIAADVPVAAWHDEVRMHVPKDVADRARDVASEVAADAVVSVGGGSATGLAKAVALKHKIPVIAVPTTFSGSEATAMWGETSEGRKVTGVDDAVRPFAVIYDAKLLAGMPVELAVSSCLNAVAHCVDSMWAPRANPLNQAIAIEGLRALTESMPRIVSSRAGLGADAEADTDAGVPDVGALGQALYGAYLAGVAFASAGSGLHHKLCHVIGGAFDTPHALTHATVLPYVLAFNAPAVPDVAARLAGALGGDASADDPAAEAVKALLRLYERVDAQTGLAGQGGNGRSSNKQGFDAAGVDRAVELAWGAIPEGNPREVTQDSLRGLLLRVAEGA